MQYVDLRITFKGKRLRALPTEDRKAIATKELCLVVIEVYLGSRPVSLQAEDRGSVELKIG